MNVRELIRPIRRRVGRLVFKITQQGIEMRGYRCRRLHVVSWAQIASLSDSDCPVTRECENNAGSLELAKLNADPSARVEQKPQGLSEMDEGYDKAMEEAWKRCREFNEQHPVGTPVTYHPRKGSNENTLATATRSKAWALPSGQAVVTVEGKTGGVLLEHIEVITVSRS